MSKQSYAAVVMSSPAPEHEMPDPPADPLDADAHQTYFKKVQAQYDALQDEAEKHRLDNKAINDLRKEMHSQNKTWPCGGHENYYQRCDILRHYLKGRTYHAESVNCHLWRLEMCPWSPDPEWLRLDPLE